MADVEERELERRAAQGDPAAAEQLHAMRARARGSREEGERLARLLGPSIGDLLVEGALHDAVVRQELRGEAALVAIVRSFALQLVLWEKFVHEHGIIATPPTDHRRTELYATESGVGCVSVSVRVVDGASDLRKREHGQTHQPEVASRCRICRRPLSSSQQIDRGTCATCARLRALDPAVRCPCGAVARLDMEMCNECLRASVPG